MDHDVVSNWLHQNINVVYRVPATGTWSPRIAYRQSLWMAGVWHAMGCRRRGLSAVACSPVKSKWRRISSFWN